MGRPDAGDEVQALLTEQIAYYRARAPEYTETAFPEVSDRDMRRAREQVNARIDDLHPRGEVLELACGPGTFTRDLLRYADALTAVDASREMLELAATKVGHDRRARFIRADLFTWEPDRRYDVVFFGFWLSHVPLVRFGSFWSMLERSLKPDGRVAFVDDAFRTPDELIEGEGSSTVLRRLNDGTEFRAVKVPHTAETLRRRIEALGWEVEVTQLAGPFYWGEGHR